MIWITVRIRRRVNILPIHQTSHPGHPVFHYHWIQSQQKTAHHFLYILNTTPGITKQLNLKLREYMYKCTTILNKTFTRWQVEVTICQTVMHWDCSVWKMLINRKVVCIQLILEGIMRGPYVKRIIVSIDKTESLPNQSLTHLIVPLQRFQSHFQLHIPRQTEGLSHETGSQWRTYPGQ